MSAPAALVSAPDTYSQQITLTPRDGAGIGTLSSYANITPVFVEGTETIKIPASEVKELNLVWTFWQHRRPDSSEWPSGPGARAVFTLESAADVTLNLRTTVRSDDWSALVPTPEIVLEANKPTRVEIVLPDAPATAPIQNIRIVFNAYTKIPELKISDWSVGQTAPANKR